MDLLTNGARFTTIKPAYALTKDRLVTHRDVAPMAYALFVLSMIAYTASIPIWQSIGYLP